MRLRHGRHQDRTLYLQHGDEPSDDDEFLGVMFSPARAAELIGIANRELPSLAEAAHEAEHQRDADLIAELRRRVDGRARSAERAAAAERSRLFAAIRHKIPISQPWRGEALDLIAEVWRESDG